LQIRFTAVPEALAMIAPNDREAALAGDAAVVVARGTVQPAASGLATLDATLRLAAARAPRAGGEFLFETARYVVRGVVLGVTHSAEQTR
jgi:hypothetical protein